MITRLIFSLTISCAVTPALGQVLSLQEIDRGGERRQIDFTALAYPIVDINSSLAITINKEAVRAIASKNKSVKSPVDREELETIANILREEKKILSLLGPCTGSYEQCRNDLKLFSGAMLNILRFVQKQRTLAARVDSIFGLENIAAGSEYKMVFTLVRNELSRMSNDIKNSAPDERYYFRLGGWIRDQSGNLRPVHIPLFDTYANGEYYDVPRFIMPVPEELRKQYSDAADAAKEYNANGITALDGLNTRINALSDSVQTILLSLNDALTAVMNFSSAIDSVKKEIKPFLDQWSLIILEANDLEKEIRTIRTSSNPMHAAVSSIGNILVLLRRMEGDVKKMSALYPSAIQTLKKIARSTVKTKVDSLLLLADNHVALLSPILNDLKVVMNAVEQWLQMDVPSQSEVNLEFSEQVKQFFIEDIPDSTEIDLRYTGQRSSGDELYLKAALTEGSEAQSLSTKSIELERKTLTMFQVDAHAKFAAGVMFLSPLSKAMVSLTNQFQAAPSYNFMVRWGSRSSYALNTFWNFGLGVNIAAPDFDLDGTPEIGYGLVVSTAKEYLQLGMGRNLSVETWYWFFGLQLPVGTVLNPPAALPESR